MAKRNWMSWGPARAAGGGLLVVAVGFGVLGGCSAGPYSDIDRREPAALAPTGFIGTAPMVEAFTTPRVLAVARVAGPTVQGNYRVRGEAFALEPRQDVEGRRDVRRIEGLPGVGRVTLLSDAVSTRPPRSSSDVVELASQVGADLVLLYTYSWETDSGNRTGFPAWLTLGIVPARIAETDLRVTALLIETQTRATLASVDASERVWQLANFYSEDAARQATTTRAMRRAFEAMVTELEKAWPIQKAAGVVSAATRPGQSG